jgi:hypothetical protein
MKSKLKKTLVVLALIAGAFVVWSAEQNNPSTGPVGRFILFQGVVETIGKGVVLKENVVFRMDTATGKTWSYTGDHRAGGLGDYWSEVLEGDEAIRIQKQRAEKRNE